jgi:8-hydroxy-5-deazaflavin:NADPH oxidoreductase
MAETLERIGIVGAGRMGLALAVSFASAGRDVMVSNSRGPETLTDVVDSIPGDVRAGTVAEATRFGELVAVVIPPGAIRELQAELFVGKIVLDVNNYFPGNVGLPEVDAGETTSSELLASLLPGAKVVKAFNAIQFQLLLDRRRPDAPPDERLAVPLAGDDAEAKRVVIGLIDELGFTGVDAGALAEGRRFEPGSPVLSTYAESRRRQELLTAPRLRELLTSSADELAAGRRS